MAAARIASSAALLRYQGQASLPIMRDRDSELRWSFVRCVSARLGRVGWQPFVGTAHVIQGSSGWCGRRFAGSLWDSPSCPGALSADDGDGCRRPLAGQERHGQPRPERWSV